MKNIFTKFSFFLILFFISCSNGNSDTRVRDKIKIKTTPNKNLDLEVLESKDDSLYYGMELGPFIFEANELKFIVQGKTLGTKTEGAENFEGRKSELGTYLHVLLNDSIHIRNSYRLIPYTLPDGSYKMLAFISRSYDESVKLPSASYAKYFEVKSGRTVKSTSLDAAVLCLNSPYGTYSKDEADNILLDFYLYKTVIGKNGNRVSVNIDNQKNFLIEDWKAYYIKGLGLGEHSISLELQNSLGQVIYGPVNETFVIEE
jgi:hypothetical protein